MDGDIIIIDDKMSEVEILIKEFSKRGVSIKYFSGERSEFPSSDFEKYSPKIVFLDLIFNTTASAQPPKTVFSSCIAKLQALISENAEYKLCVWTTYQTEDGLDSIFSKNKFEEELEKIKIKPKDVIFLSSKQSIIYDGKDIGNDDIDLIEDISLEILKVKFRGKILEISLDLENELNSFITENIILDNKKTFYKEKILCGGSMSLMGKLRLLQTYYIEHKKTHEPRWGNIGIDSRRITGIRNAVAHQELEKLIIGKITYDFNKENIDILIKELIEYKKKIKKINQYFLSQIISN